MNLLPFGSLPPFRPRQFVPASINWDRWEEIEPLFTELDKRPLPGAAALEQWILDWGELSAALDEESSRRYIAMTCHTENADAEKAYLHFVEVIDPQLKPRQFALSKRYLAEPARQELSKKRYEVFDRDTALGVELFRPENVPLETEEAKLGQQFQKLSGSLTVQFRGEEKTLVQMARHLEETDRALRQEAWELVARRRLQESEKFDQIFDDQMALRQKIASNAGFKNYRDYAFRARGRFDYTPEDCEHFHEAIEKDFVPAMNHLYAERKKKLGLDKLRPWDLVVDPENRPPLRPFQDVSQLTTRTEKIFSHLDPKLARHFRTMQDLKLLDLANRKGKAPGGYQSTLSESRLPFIFMNAVGVHRDVETMLHEAGHAFHALAAQSEDLFAYRHAPIEFCEVASMSMELLGNRFLEEFYSASEAKRARRTHLEGIIGLFPWIASVDAFQHWIYTHPNHTRVERRKAWMEIMDRFGGDVDWSGFEEVRENLWHRQLHIFIHPFYYIEYGIAQLGALQVWANSVKEPKRALEKYWEGLSLGGSRPLPELFAAAGCRFDFSRETVKPLLELVREELGKA